MRILIVSEVFFPEEFIINELAKNWIERGINVDVLTRNPAYPFGRIFKGYRNKLFQTEVIHGIRIYRVHIIQGYGKNKKIKLVNYFWNALLASLVALKIGKNYEHVFIFQTGPLSFSFAGILIKKIYHKSTTIWTQDIWPDSIYAYGINPPNIIKYVINCFVKGIYKNCDNILVSSEALIPKIKHFVKSKEALYIPNWSIIDFKEIENCKSTTTFSFVFAGNIGMVQNLENVIKGFDKFIKDSKANVSLNIVGDGSNLSFIKNLSIELGCKNVNFLGKKDAKEMPKIYQENDVLIISLIDKPIFELTIPSKFQTYLSAKKPIMCVMKGEVAKIVQKYNLGYISNPSDIQDIANIMKKFYDLDKKTMFAFGNNAGNLHKTVFNKEKIINNLTSIILKTKS